MTGLNLAQYRIDAELGRGGMGIVYRATDTKLNRMVALKVLPASALASEADRARFFREAQAAAQLSHPNVCHIYQVDEAVPTDPDGSPVPGETDKRPFIAMEYIRGGQLDDGLSERPLPIPRVIEIAIQIGEALRAAHERGIVHRDIKSANVMLTDDGTAKVLDFGLAKTNASTKLTQMGSTVGTIAYMSPEQARGEEVDHRTDLWSLGAVLYEILTGRLPFAGAYEQAVVYGILNGEPEPVTSLRTAVPVALEQIVQKCLRKEREHRYQSAADVIADLRALASGVSTSRSAVAAVGAVGAVPVDRSRAWTPLVPWILFAVTVVALAVVWSRGPAGLPPRPLVSELDFGQPSGLNFINGIALSPDESRLAYTSWPSHDGGRVWIRELASGDDRPLEGTQGASFPFWSPDGQQIGYFVETHLSVISVGGGAPRRLAAVGNPEGGSWAQDGRIAFADDGALFMIPAGGGTPEPVAGSDGKLREPAFVPGRSEMFYTTGGSITGAGGDTIMLATGSATVSVSAGSKPIPVSEHLFVYKGEIADVFARRFDLGPGPVGDPVSLFANVATPSGYPQLTATAGTIIYLVNDRAAAGGFSNFGWRDLDAHLTEPIPVAQIFWNYQVSPDGKRLAFGGLNLQIRDLDRGITELQTLDRENTWPYEFAWAPDSRHIAYTSDAAGDNAIRVYSLEDQSTALLMETGLKEQLHALHWTPDGSILAISGNEAGSRELWKFDPETGRKERILAAEGRVYGASVDPTGQWIAYAAGAGSLARQIYLRSWPELGPRFQVSLDGGTHPLWARGGQQLFYLNKSGEIEVADLDPDAASPSPRTTTLPVGSVDLLPYGGAFTHFGVHPDGDRILLTFDPSIDVSPRAIVLRDWQARLAGF